MTFIRLMINLEILQYIYPTNNEQEFLSPSQTLSDLVANLHSPNSHP